MPEPENLVSGSSCMHTASAVLRQRVWLILDKGGRVEVAVSHHWRTAIRHDAAVAGGDGRWQLRWGQWRDRVAKEPPRPAIDASRSDRRRQRRGRIDLARCLDSHLQVRTISCTAASHAPPPASRVDGAGLGAPRRRHEAAV